MVSWAKCGLRLVLNGGSKSNILHSKCSEREEEQNDEVVKFETAKAAKATLVPSIDSHASKRLS